jgi:hypothetical protein
MTDNTLLYVAIALAVLALAVYKYSKHREAKFQEKKQAHIRKKICEDTAIISNFVDERLSLNLMALDAARQMAASASKSPNYGQKSD